MIIKSVNPCIECICKPLCRQSSLQALCKKCSLLDDYIEANSKRHKPHTMRLILSTTMDEVNQVFKWGLYEEVNRVHMDAV